MNGTWAGRAKSKGDDVWGNEYCYSGTYERVCVWEEEKGEKSEREIVTGER